MATIEEELAVSAIITRLLKMNIVGILSRRKAVISPAYLRLVVRVRASFMMRLTTTLVYVNPISHIVRTIQDLFNDKAVQGLFYKSKTSTWDLTRNSKGQVCRLNNTLLGNNQSGSSLRNAKKVLPKRKGPSEKVLDVVFRERLGFEAL